MKVLIVDDEILVRKGISMSIPWNTLGFDCVFEASNGFDALETAIRESPDLIITDIRMPRMDGIQLIEELRNKQISSVVICLSCLTDMEHIRKAMRFDGAIDYIPKLSMTNDELIEIIKKSLCYIKKEKLPTVLASSSSTLLSFEQRFVIRLSLQQNNFSALKSMIEELFGQYSILTIKDCIIPNILDIYAELFSEMNYNIYQITLNQNDIMSYLRLSGHLPLKETFNTVLETIFREYMYILKQRYGDDIVTAINYMYLNYKKTIGLMDLSQLLAMNTSYFSKYFKKKTQINYVSFLNSIRLEKAKEYLEHTDYPIIQIAIDVGFTNETYFSRLFKNIEGISPAAYRAQRNPGFSV